MGTFSASHRSSLWLLAALLFGVALAVRLLPLGRFVTPDELVWVYRSMLFREALGDGRFADTLVAGHPGVTTTWLGSLAMSLQLLLRPGDGEAYIWLTRLTALTPDNMAAFQHLAHFLSGGRIVVAAANSLGVVAVFGLLARLLDRRVALLAATLLAVDPFFGGLSGLLHVDGLLTTAVTLALLTLALAVGLGATESVGRRQVIWAALSGGFAALAVLSKTPGLLLLPVVALALLATLIQRQGPLLERLGVMVALGLMWLGGFVLVAVLLFPALWADPQSVLSIVSGNTSRHVEEALRPTFFMGDVSYDHGPAFYPLAVLWRSTPLVLAGLVAMLALLVQHGTWVQLQGRRLLLLLAAWSGLFLLVISVAAKKFDRYALPVFPALIILAVVALVGVRWPDRRLRVVLLSLLAALQGIMFVSSGAVQLSAYNLLLGGPWTARQVLPIGWGEGISYAGRWLATQDGTAQQTAVSGIAPSLAPFFPGETLYADREGPQAADYVIVTAGGRQEDAAAAARAVAGMGLRRVVRYGFLDQAWVYTNPAPQRSVPQLQPLAEPLSFGGQMGLLAQEIVALDRDVRYTMQWVRWEANARPLLRLSLRDPEGTVWSAVETPVLNEVAFAPPDWATDETPQVSYYLRMPPAIPPGTYFVEVSLLDGTDGSFLPLFLADGAFGGVVYAAGEVTVQTPLRDINPGALGLSAVIDQRMAGESLRFLGPGTWRARALAGGVLPLTLFWQARESLPAGLQIGLQLGDSQVIAMPLSRFDSGLWERGRIVQEQYQVPLPPDLLAGTYPLTLQLLDSQGAPLVGDSVGLGAVRIDALDRLFDLPPDLALPLDVTFAEGVRLRGADRAALQVAAGEPLPLTLYWQAAGQTTVPVTAFVHLVDEAGEIVAQADRWPGGLPSNTWSRDQIIVDEHAIELPADLPQGEYQLGVGLYTAADGQRLAVVRSGGLTAVADRVLLPLPVVVSERSQ